MFSMTIRIMIINRGQLIYIGYRFSVEKKICIRQILETLHVYVRIQRKAGKEITDILMVISLSGNKNITASLS